MLPFDASREAVLGHHQAAFLVAQEAPERLGAPVLAVEPTAPGFAAQLAGAVASGLAFVFASRGYGEWPL